MTKFVLAPDSFKESMTARVACQSMTEGIRKIYPEAEIVQIPMADGGEGTLDCLMNSQNDQKIDEQVMGPLSKTLINCHYGLIEQGKTAVIEMALANGLELLPIEKRNPLITSTYGTGQLIKSALDKGVEKIIICIGGSATNDGGAGMAQALGYRLLDKNGNEIPFGGGNLNLLERIDCENSHPRLREVEIVVASDVTNPLTGLNGASNVFGRQKGATEEMVVELDSNLHHFAKVIARDLKVNIENTPGSGAAGGLGAGLLAFTKAKIISGFQIVSEQNELEKHIAQADYVFTGEGGIDSQTAFGKVPSGVAKIAKKYNKPVIAFAGYIGEDLEVLYQEGITAIFGILPKVESLENALLKGKEDLRRESENVSRLIKNTSHK
ncbi:glycerate kinase [Floricoccus penangensis]|uniref:Glycerate kinase n=2 Tax=Floricoccus penangensis TaxID=1859475 RepID=A0A9Q5NZ59_9LACT|nr:glycerate kinase [Floricoccus penangensis]